METENENLTVARKQFQRLGTEIDLQILLFSKKGFQEAEDCLALAEKEIIRLEKIFSRFDKNSELSRLNLHLGKSAEASEELLEVSKLCREYYDKTLGYFDPRIIGNLEAAGYREDFSKIVVNNTGNAPQAFDKNLSEDICIQDGKISINCRLDLAGVAKGWIVDRIAEYFKEMGFENFVVDLGGDMYFSGRGPTGKAWYIDIESIEFEKILFNLSDKAIATSGIGKRKWEINGSRFHHLINPLAPEEFSFELKSATVISDKTMDADVWAKTIFLMGREKGLQFAEENKIACAILDYKGNVFISKEIKKYIYDHV